MFYHYEIRNNGKEDILYLYLSLKYEFSREFINNDEDLGRRTNNFIQSNNIPYKGNKVYLVIDGVVVKCVSINKTNNYIEDNLYSNNNFLINVVLDDQSLSEITLKDYLLSILFSYYDYLLEDEVLKSLCILYTTYIYKTIKENNYILSNDSFASYKPLLFYKEKYSNYYDIYEKLSCIIDQVDCIFLKYNNQYILPFIHYSNNGKTISNSKYPYLSSVKSLWDYTSKSFININTFNFSDLNNLLNTNITSYLDIKIYEKGNDKRIVIKNKIFSFEEFRNILNLSSSYFNIIIYKNYIKVINFGCGNFYGLSLFGANEIAKEGGKYYQILKYYFPKVNIFKYIKRLS